MVFMVWTSEPQAEITSQSNYQMDKAAYYMLQRERENPSGSATNLFMPHFTCQYNKSNDHHIVKGIFVPVVSLA